MQYQLQLTGSVFADTTTTRKSYPRPTVLNTPPPPPPHGARCTSLALTFVKTQKQNKLHASRTGQQLLEAVTERVQADGVALRSVSPLSRTTRGFESGKWAVS